MKKRPSTGHTLIFVGPTLPADEVRELLPDATVMPPAAVGDILRAAHDKRVRRIAIIDGYFERMAAIWHKEILVALERGSEVWGAASMGALRAAELQPWGMRGVGVIYQWYRRGALRNDDRTNDDRTNDKRTNDERTTDDDRTTEKRTTDDDRTTEKRTNGDRTNRRRTSGEQWREAVTADDEVAVAHLPAEYGFKAVSEPLFNIRYNLEAAARGGIISRTTANRLLRLAQARFYRERTWQTLFEDARAAKLPANELAAIEQASKVDRKADDARLLLVKLRSSRKLARRKIRVPRTWALRQLERLML